MLFSVSSLFMSVRQQTWLLPLVVNVSDQLIRERIQDVGTTLNFCTQICLILLNNLQNMTYFEQHVNMVLHSSLNVI